MVATTFAADTPLVVAGLVAKYGVAGNWLWWNGAISGILTVFFFARLWRRAGVLTDLEFAELRYGGKPAAVLRGFRALYLAMPINLIIMGWVTRAMVTILQISLNIDPWTAALILFGSHRAVHHLLRPLGRGRHRHFPVRRQDGWRHRAGGLRRGVRRWARLAGPPDRGRTSVRTRPRSASSRPTDKAWLPLSTLIVFLSVQWWAAWYPGAEPGGGGYVAQRILSAKDERHGLLATLWFQIAHYALRPWPWILVGFVAVIRYPNLANPEEGYVRVMVDVLPSPLKGLLLATFAAAYMSTIGTHLNWGASYLVNDVYLRFLKPSASRRAQVMASRVATVILMLLSLVVMAYLTSVEQGWKLLIGLGAGTGAVFILRWYWWRINAWSEISAMAASFVTSIALHFHGGERRRYLERGLRPGDADHRRGDHGGLARGDLPDGPRARRRAGRVLPEGSAGGAGVAAGGRAAGLRGRPDSRGGPVLGQLGGRGGGGVRRALRRRGLADRESPERVWSTGGWRSRLSC